MLFVICLLWKAYVLNLSKMKISMVEVITIICIKWLFVKITYFNIITINMRYMFIKLFDNIMFIIDMVMSCDIISDIACIIYFLCEILIVCGIKCNIILGYIVCSISVKGAMFIKKQHY